MLAYTQSHTTKPWFVWPIVLVVAAGGIAVFASSMSSGSPDPIVGWCVLVFVVVLGPAIVAALRLTYIVSDHSLRIVYRPIWTKTIPLARIDHAEAVAYRPMWHYQGWGIRWNPLHGWAYTLSGDTGVRIHLAAGGSILLGSPDPEPLAEAINDAAGRA
jgi:hypothetical protein